MKLYHSARFPMLPPNDGASAIHSADSRVQTVGAQLAVAVAECLCDLVLSATVILYLPLWYETVAFIHVARMNGEVLENCDVVRRVHLPPRVVHGCRSFADGPCAALLNGAVVEAVEPDPDDVRFVRGAKAVGIWFLPRTR